MIQRIQTVYLLIAEILTTVLFFSKLGSILTPEGKELVLTFKGLFQVNGDKLEKMFSAWPLAVLLIVIAVVGFFVIFLYRRRMFQIRICFLAMALNLGLAILLAYYLYSIGSVGGQNVVALKVVDSFPIVSIVLYYLAYRGIAKDEAMVIASSFRSRR